MLRRGSVNGSAASSRIRVAVRVRPPDCKIPKDETRPPCVTPSPHANTPNALEFRHNAQAKTFTFDHVFGASATQDEVYASALQPLMAQFLDGYNVTVMAYGQTGSGKTHTMGNKASVFNTTPTTSPCRERASSIPPPTIMTPETRGYQGSTDDGLMPRFLNDLFMNLKKEPSMKEIRVTFVEVYCDTIRDLLDDRTDKTLSIREDAHNVWVENVRSIQVENLTRALEVLNAGRARQTVGANALNDESSRSHAVYTMEVSRKFLSEIKKSKVTFVDLAGSERIKKTQVEGKRQQESIHINVGLSALGNVINALADERKSQRRMSQGAPTSHPSSPDKGTHIPYRTSKLTRLLRDGLGGNARTLIIACVSPLDSNADETVNTLQFVNRARNIQNKVERNVNSTLFVAPPNPFELEVARLQDEVKRLQQQIGDLETAARKREQEMALAEQARAQRKEKKRDERRDAEMTTEIMILPQVDAHTQHEGEDTGEKRLAVVDADTMTDSVEDIPVPTRVSCVDTFAQTSVQLNDAEIMTDEAARSMTTEVCTVYDIVAVPCCESETQFGTSYVHLNDVGVVTDPAIPVETRETSTECVAINIVDTACQHDVPAIRTLDAQTITDVEAARATRDAFTECLLGEFVDAECQFGLSSQDYVDIAVATDPEPAIESPQSLGACGVDAMCQSDLFLFAEIGILTDAEPTLETTDVSTECLGVSVADTACQSEVFVTPSADISTFTDPVAVIETLDASTDCAAVCMTDEACQSGTIASHVVEFGMTTDPESTISTSDVSTESPSVDVVHTASQSDVSCFVDVGITADAAESVPTADVTVKKFMPGTVDAAVQSELPIFAEAVPSERTVDTTSVGRGVADTAGDKACDHESAEDFGVHVLADVGQIVCLSPTSSVSTLSDTGDHPPSVETPALSDEPTESVKQDKVLSLDEVFAASSKAAVICSSSTPMKLSRSASFSSLSDSFAIQEVFAAARIDASDDTLLGALEVAKPAKASRSLTPEVHDEELVKTASNQSEVDSHQEIAASGHGIFVCSPLGDVDDEFPEFRATTRGVSEDRTNGCHVYELAAAPEEQTRLVDPVPTFDCIPAALSLVVKTSTIQTSYPDDLQSIEQRRPTLQQAPLQLPGSPVPDFVVVRSPRRGAAAPQQISPRGGAPKRHASPSHQAVRPLRMFTFDDKMTASTPEKTAVQAKHLCENLRQLARDEFGNDIDINDPAKHRDVDAPHSVSTVGQLMTETKDFIKRRQQRQQRIAQLRSHVLALEELLQVESRAPLSEPELKAYSERVQEEFLNKLIQQLVTLAAERLHRRLQARVEAEQVIPLPSGEEDDTTCPFLSLDQCHACAEWFFHCPNDPVFFEKQILPLVTSRWISLTPGDLEAEQAWFQL